MKDKLNITGELKLTIGYPDGSEKVTTAKNLIVTQGLEHIAAVLTGTYTALENIAIGTGTTPVAVDDDDLEMYEAVGTATHSQDPSNLNHAVFEVEWAAGDLDGSYTEAGIFDTHSGNTFGFMFNRAVFAAQNVSVSNTFKITWTIKIKNKA
jgi:hypothetical protein